MTFSQDEINLMCIYDTSDKTELLQKVIIRNLRNCKKVYYQNLSPYGK